MPLLDPSLDEDFSKVKLAANEIVKYSYRWIFGHPPNFDDVHDFLSYFQVIEGKLDTGFAHDILNDLSELAIATRISTFADDVSAIHSACVKKLEAAGHARSSQHWTASQLPPEVRQDIRALFGAWRKRFDAVRNLSIDQLRTLPSITDENIVEQEVRAFDLSTRLERARAASDRNQVPRPVARCIEASASPGGAFNLRIESFAVFKGEIVACVGPNGSGKSTFLRLLAGLLSPTAGEVSYPFIDADHADQPRCSLWPARRRKIAFVAQEPELGDMRLDKHIALNLARTGILGESNRALTHLFLERFRLFGKTERAPRNMSSGERKLAAMACALSTAPDLLLLDEPLSSLDYIATMHFLEDINRAAKGNRWGNPAIVFSSHHLDEQTWLADRLFSFADGEVRSFEVTDAASVFEIVFRDGASAPPEVQLPEGSGLEYLRISGRSYIRSPVPRSIAEIAALLESGRVGLISINDITRNPKRSFLGI